MKRTLLALSLFLAVSCGSKKEKIKYIEVNKKTFKVMPGILTFKDSSRILDWAGLQEVTRFDSVLNRVVIDSTGGQKQFIPLKDSLGKLIIGKDGNPMINPEPVFIAFPKDSIRWNISGIPFDSLVKKTAPTHD